jgi:site-specific DNA-methyltransferase (adenine-specific)
MADQSVNCCVTSPPYFGLRDYGVAGQMGLEATPDEFVNALVTVLREVRRVLTDDGTLWLNLGDSYARNPAKGQHKPGDSGKQAYLYDTGGGRASCTSQTGLADKQLIGIPWRVAFALQADGWILRQDIIWQKPNVMPESVKDRCTKSHEYIFLLTKSPKYFFDHESIKEPVVCTRKPGRKVKETNHYSAKNGGNSGLSKMLERYHDGTAPTTRSKRSVWTVPPVPFKGAHFATFPPALIEPCILAGCPVGGVVLDPFGGSGTTAGVALAHGRKAVLCELNPGYAELIPTRISNIVSAAHGDLV